MIPKYFEYFNSVKVVAGKQALARLPEELLNLGVKKPILVTDKGVVNAGLVKVVEENVAGSGVSIGAVYDETPVDSSIHAVNAIAAIYREKGCDSIIAVGGGSAIDTAKGVNIVLSENTDDLMKFTGNNRVRAVMKPFVVIPTTGGTGSEVTMAAVIANPDLGVKMQFTTPLMLPDFTILDPRMTKTMPPKITAATGMDAMTHAVETFMSIQRNPVSDAFAWSAIELLVANLPKAVTDGDDEDVRLAVATGAMLAGIAFSNSMVGVVHAVAHALGGVCHLPHGIANAIILPFGMEFNLPKARDVLSDMLLVLAGPEVFAATPKKQRAEKSIATVRDLIKTLNRTSGLPVCLEQAGVPRNKLEKVARIAVSDGAANFNPIEIEYQDALNILNRAYA
ncbi:iron-containing alcohol dehydrogenase [Desulfosudis oleivorans]|uniref:Iron-containing alcohol dehydrogenase n=1 Tax=Desulfosudis oleivorans (strain DSM 6200 / JCM 39069 / Hxd3) TaxID=96561 RepID=A8ZV04_DESOH|nr:iron-containing alcohol dehydrogenase [Desulfosudis oleivorans]ABW68094.1 iron-containing alcohol dehydrogenase [Desulfosudis oleivorans Hxd3]